MNQTKLAEICFVASHLQAFDSFLMNMIQVSWIQVSYAMSIVGIQKGYGKIWWLDMLDHRIFPRQFWFLQFLSYQLFRCPSVQVCPKFCPDTASALLHARKIRLKQVVWPYYYTDSVCAAQVHGCAARVQCNAMKGNAMQCNAMQCNVMQCNEMQWNVMQCNAMKYNAMYCNAM